jgi:hypothetical protein
LKIGIDYNEYENMMGIWTEEANSIVDCKKGTLAKTIGGIVEKRHFQR